MPLTPIQTFIVICMVTLGTLITRFLPFILFKDNKGKNPYIEYLGRVLPYSAVGLLVVYSFKDISFKSSTHGIPEFIAIICITVLHCWKKNTMLSIGVGTVIYMILVQVIFI